MQLRKALLVLALTVAISTIALPNVRAQSTSITHLDAPSTAVVGESVTVRVGATYDLGSNGYAVSIGIFDLDAWWATGTATSEENTCHTYTSGQIAQQAFCGYVPSTHSGSDVVIFQLTFSTVKTYKLRASVELYDSKANLISGVNTFQDFTITVQSTSNSLVTYTPTPSAVTSTPSLQMPQPPQPEITQSTNNTPTLALALAVAAVVIAAAFMYSRRKGQVKKAEKTDTKKTSPSKKNFCIECGSELPLKSKFCNNCGNEQP